MDPFDWRIDPVFPVGDENILSPEKWTWNFQVQRLNKRSAEEMISLTAKFWISFVSNKSWKSLSMFEIFVLSTEIDGNFWYCLSESVVIIVCLQAP